MNNSDLISESLETIFWVKILKFCDADPGWKKFGSGINIPDPQHLKLLENMMKKKNFAKFHFLSNCSRCEVLQEII